MVEDYVSIITNIVSMILYYIKEAIFVCIMKTFRILFQVINEVSSNSFFLRLTAVLMTNCYNFGEPAFIQQ